MINSLQFLRAVAALMVLFYHAQTMIYEKIGYAGSFTNTGAAGVDIFFVISGFVIYLVFAKNTSTPTAFLVKRIIRVGPPYWLYTSITVALLLFVPAAYKKLTFDPAVVASSYLFLMSEVSEGAPGTLLGVGWTIAYEMYFYLLFFIALITFPKRPLELVGVIIVLGALVSAYIPAGSIPAFSVVAISVLPLEFLAGCLIARYYLRGVRIPHVAAVLLIAIGCAAILFGGITQSITDDRGPWRVLYWGVPAALVVASLVSIDSQRPIRFPKFVLVLGAASYSLYLCHQFVLAAMVKIVSALHLKEVVPAEAVLLVGMLFAIGVSLLSYYLFERPVTNWLNNAFAQRRGANVPAHV